MAKVIKRNIVLDNGFTAEASLPVIISASRATDVPAFYADWFFYRLEKGYSVWKNPFNGKDYYIGYTKEYVKVAKASQENLENQLVSGTLSQMLTDEIYLMD